MSDKSHDVHNLLKNATKTMNFMNECNNFVIYVIVFDTFFFDEIFLIKKAKSCEQTFRNTNFNFIARIFNFIENSKIRKKTIFIFVEHFYTFMMIVRTIFAIVFDRNALTLRKSIMNQNTKTSTFTTCEKFLFFFFKQRKQ